MCLSSLLISFPKIIYIFLSYLRLIQNPNGLDSSNVGKGIMAFCFPSKGIPTVNIIGSIFPCDCKAGNTKPYIIIVIAYLYSICNMEYVFLMKIFCH